MNIFNMNEEEIANAISLPVSDEDEEQIIECPTHSSPPPPDLSALSPELLSAFKIVDSLMVGSNRFVNLPFMNSVDPNAKHYRNYYQVVKKPMWLRRIHAELLSESYTSITEVISDLRLILENCYRYFGRNHPNIKKGFKLETIIEQKIALLPSNLRELTALEVTSPHLARLYAQLQEHNQQQGATQPGLSGNKYNSIIFQCVREEKAQKERERRREQMEERKAEREAAHQETLHWEEALLADHASDIRKMWELPQIGHFLYLAQRTLNLPEVSQYELERSLFMPTGSSLMATIMTSLLSSPHQRTKLDQWPSMRYKTWASRLQDRVQHWYKVYTNKERNLLKVFEIIGIEPEFFRIMGDTNPMERKSFQELTLKQRIWVFKSLCDYCLHNHKTVQDSIMEGSFEDQRESVLGEDKEGNQYVHFPQFCGQSLRIYRMTKDLKIPDLDLKPPSPTPTPEEGAVKVEVKEDEPKVEDEKAGKAVNHRKRKGKRGAGRPRKSEKKAPAKPQPPSFELVVESVEELRNLMDCFVEVPPKNIRRQAPKRRGCNSNGQPFCEKQLHKRLKNLLGELEPWEQKLEQAIIKSRLKLKKEWEERKLKDAHQEEDADEFWGMQIEEEVPQQVDQSSSSDNFSEAEDDPNASEFRQTHKRTCTRRKRVWESESSVSDTESEPFKITVSSRGRVCKMRNFNYVPAVEKITEKPEKTATQTPVTIPPVVQKKVYKAVSKPVVVTLNGMQPKQRDMLEAHRSQNSASDAQMQYQWETMRLKLLKESNSERNSPKVKCENEEKPQETFVARVHKPAEDEDVLDKDIFLSAGPDFGSWKSSVPGSAFAEQTFSTLLEKAPSFSPPQPPPPKTAVPQKKVEIVRLSMASSTSNVKTFVVPPNNDKPKQGIFRDKNATGNDRRFVKTTFTAPGILRSTITKRPSPPTEPTKPSALQTALLKQTSTPTTATTGTVIPSLARPGQKILVLPIKDASGNKVLLQVLPKGAQPLKFSHLKSGTNLVTKGLNETKITLPISFSNHIKQAAAKPVQAQQIVTKLNHQQLVSHQTAELQSHKQQQFVSTASQQRLISNASESRLSNKNHYPVENQQLPQTQHQPLSVHTDPLHHAVATEILQSPISPNQMLQNSILTQDLSGHHILQTPVSQPMTNSVLHNSVSQDMGTSQLTLTPCSQELVTSQILHNQVSQTLTNNQILQTSISTDYGTNQILHSPPHDHFSPQNISPPTNQLLGSPADHSQLIHTYQSSNAAHILASSLAGQNQVLQTSPNQILTCGSPVLTHPDGSVTLLTQGSTSTMVLPVQTQIYAPQIYASSEPKVLVCTNGQVLDGNMSQESLFVMTPSGQLVSMDNCTFQQMSPL